MTYLSTWGRVPDENGDLKWVEVTTDENGYNDMVWAVSLVQALDLVLGEAPFNANLGIPQTQSVVQQIPPDVYVAQIQRWYAPYFGMLTILRDATSPFSDPTYNGTILFHSGATTTLDKIPH